MRDPKAAPLALISVLFFFSGTVALVYEILWQRQFSLLFGSSAPATAAVLAACFGGLSCGNFLFGRISRRWRRPLVAYGIIELLIGFSALAVTPTLNLYASAYPGLITRFGASPATLILVKGVLAFVAIALPTLAMGATLPVLANLLDADRARLGNRVALLYLLNTAGAAVGTLAVPLVLLPRFG